MKNSYKLMLLGIAVILLGFCFLVLWGGITAATPNSWDWYKVYGRGIIKIIANIQSFIEIIMTVTPITGFIIVVLGFSLKDKK